MFRSRNGVRPDPGRGKTVRSIRYTLHGVADGPSGDDGHLPKKVALTLEDRSVTLTTPSEKDENQTFVLRCARMK